MDLIYLHFVVNGHIINVLINTLFSKNNCMLATCSHFIIYFILYEKFWI